MKEFIQIKIDGVIYNLYNASLDIYKRDNSIVIESNNEQANIYNNKFNPGDKDKNNPPISINYDANEDNIILYIDNKYSDVFCSMTNVEITEGINHINIDNFRDKTNFDLDMDIEFKKSVNIFDKNKNKLRIEFKIVTNDDVSNDSNSYSDNKQDIFMNPYSKDYSGSVNIEDKVQDMFHKDPNTIDINSGCSRSIFKINDTSKYNFIDESDGCIIKVDQSGDIEQENMKEIQAWQAVKGTELEKYFCSITNIGKNHSYIVMKKADVMTDQSEKSLFKEKADIIKNRLEDKTKLPDDFERGEDDTPKSCLIYQWDINARNVGILNDRPVLIDYPFGARVNILENTSNKDGNNFI